jgi:general secretion pathway protein M
MTEWYQNITLEERQFVWLGALCVILLLLYLFLVRPLEAILGEGMETLRLKQSEFTQLSRIASEYTVLGAAKNSNEPKDNRSLLAIIDNSGSDIGIKSSIKRLTPEGENKVRVRIEDVEFDKLIKWLAVNSRKHFIHAELFLVKKNDKKGRVNATLLLARN